MSSTFNGLALQQKYVDKYGFSDSKSYTRILEWINSVQDDIQASHAWPFLKIKIKKQIVLGDQEIDISPQIPVAPTLALLAGGAISAGDVLAKVSFVIFDESGKIQQSIESEAGPSSNTVTTDVSGNGSVTVTGVDVYNGDTTVKPNVFWRRIYLSVAGGNFYLAATIQDNTTTTVAITTNPASVIEPTEYTMVSCMAGEDPLVERAGICLYENKLQDLIKFDPTLRAGGTPQYYCRTGPTKVLLYPKPSSTYTLSYWVYRIPARIYADATIPLQLHHALKEALDAGVTWKFYEYKDTDGQESKKLNYEARKADAKGIVGRLGGQAPTVKVIC